ncbi:hypothetical protein GCM10008018_69870 [Paenibacillus marchantiophytorum]|uniref:Copper amine oxidase-like N-terminal domain-containing protein n=1 Tax=Paenibacillus marchantiophytorum TaxID=1619310 RepID=A0ABQ1FJP9_9BACL|nr:stalk domain-containing protein [Paenibacillus marchantiophytorum]GGA15102.1 hypothetical protein GCM10008018_69870 [Paenibacillus marchantiophytorum]
MKLQALCFSFLLILISVLMPSPMQAATDEVKIKDPVLEKAIRDELKLTQEQVLDYKVLQKLTSLYPRGTEKIKSLEGLERAINLTKLFVANQEITDVAPLRYLYQLNFVALNNNKIKNICPVSNLSRLQKLIINNNEIESIGCLSQLTSLTDLLASKNHILDISSLAKLPIKWLDIASNPVTDISSIGTIEELRTLFIDENELNEKSKLLLEQLEQSGMTVNKAPNLSNPVDGLAVIVNQDRVIFDHPPILETGTTLVQFRPLFEKLGFTIRWEDETRTIYASKVGVSLKLQVDNVNAALNGTEQILPVAPKNVEGNIFVPIRFVGEASSFDVTLENSSKTIYLIPSHDVISPNQMSQITVSGKWLSKPSGAFGDQIYLAKGNNAITIATESKEYLEEIKTLEDYEKGIKKSIEAQNVKEYSQSRTLTINGLSAIQFSYSANSEALGNYTVVQTLLNGKYNFYRVILVAGELVYSEIEKDYQNIIKTFHEIKTMPQLAQDKFGAMTPKERAMDAAHYYRKFGFFQKDSQLTDQQFTDKFLAFYEGFIRADWNPFDSSEWYNEFAELYVLEQDKDRVWLKDTETDVLTGNERYVQALQEWSVISRGAFKPTDIVEKWNTDEGPVTVSFMLNGLQRTIHPEYMSDFLDTSILGEINEWIKETGYQFVEVVIDQEVFVTALSPDEKAKMEKDRLIDFDSWGY